MKTIIPLEYEIKILKINVLDSTLENYKKIDFMKKSISDTLFFFENQVENKFKPLKIQQRKIWLYQEIEIIDSNLLFINFKYWDSVNQSDNSVIIENEKIAQVINKTWDFLTDFPCWISFNIREDSKYLFISWKMAILANRNEQMKWKIKEIFEKIYIHNNQWENDITPKININFYYTKEEVQLIDAKVRWIKMTFNVPRWDLFKQWEEWFDKDNARLEIKYSWWKKIGTDNEKELENFIKELEEKIWNFWKLVSRTAEIRDNKKTYKTEVNNLNDELIVNLKEAVIATSKEMSYDDFKKLSMDYLKKLS